RVLVGSRPGRCRAVGPGPAGRRTVPTAALARRRTRTPPSNWRAGTGRPRGPPARTCSRSPALLFGFLLRGGLSETLEKPFRERKVGESPRQIDDMLILSHRRGAPLTDGEMILVVFVPVRREVLGHEGVHPLEETVAAEHDEWDSPGKVDS